MMSSARFNHSGLNALTWGKLESGACLQYSTSRRAVSLCHPVFVVFHLLADQKNLKSVSKSTIVLLMVPGRDHYNFDPLAIIIQR